ncbi:MAG TPA: pyridoxal-dependent decarboxylase [Bryobacteraceae bacterium]|nr:pyridoxal-dependent decarboxylase [Bryobacteraceae bacterium]
MANLNRAFRDSLDAAFQHSVDHLEGLDRRSVAATANLETLRNRLGKPLADDGLEPQQVITELVDDVAGGIIGSAGGRYFAGVVGGSLPAALAADWLAAAWDQNAVLYATGPAAAIVEETAGAWLKDIFGLPAGAGFALVTGCQMAHATCLAAARHAILVKRGWDVEQRGLYGAPPIRILSGQDRHGSTARAIRLLGLGLEQIVDLPTDAEGRLHVGCLEEALASDPNAPTIVLTQAGEINTGAFDQFEIIVPIAHRYGAWLHVDGAIGLWAAASRRFAHLVRGVGQADSWATDGHKWLNVPYDCGYAFVVDAEAQRASMAHRAPYLRHAANARDQMDWTPEWSRRARAFPTYAALRQLGRKGLAGLVERCSRHAHSLVTRIGRLPGAEMLWEPIINQGLVRFLDTKPGATDPDHDRRTEEVIEGICATGEAVFGGTTWRGKRAMRVSVCNWQISDEDVERVVKAVAEVMGVSAISPKMSN